MLKTILQLSGAQSLGRTEQIEISGGRRALPPGYVVNCNGQPNGTPCSNADGTCPGICFNTQCAMY
ncbi:MAG: hypothetical protein AAF985_15580 [Bacteroidota bacterium]